MGMVIPNYHCKNTTKIFFFKKKKKQSPCEVIKITSCALSFSSGHCDLALRRYQTCAKWIW